MIEKIKKIFHFFVPIGFKKYIRIWAVIFSVGMIISIIIAIISAVIASRESSAPKDVYVIQGNSLPSFESVVGKRHGDLWRDEGDEIIFAYLQTETSTEDVKKYVKHLQDENGYEVFEEPPLDDDPEMSSLIKKAVDSQQTICISITYPQENQKDQDVFISIKLWDVEYDKTLKLFREQQGTPWNKFN